MKRLIVLVTLAVFFVAGNASAQVAPMGKPNPAPKPPTSFSDNFNDGDLAGWSLTALAYPGGGIGNWRVEDGVLVQDLMPDHVKALVSNLVLSSQSVETSINVHPYGYGGITVWYQDAGHWVDVWSYPGYQRMEVWEENTDADLGYSQTMYDLYYPGGDWNKLRVDADSRAGTLKVYVDDVLLFTHQITIAERSGLSGLNSGNYGTHFDDFKVRKVAVGRQ